MLGKELRCPIFLWQIEGNSPNGAQLLDPERLAQSALSSDGSLSVTLTKSPKSLDGFLFKFERNSGLFEKLRFSSDLQQSRGCHFKATMDGHQSVLNACSFFDISGLLRMNGRVFVLDALKKDFYLIPVDNKGCGGWSSNLNSKHRRSTEGVVDGGHKFGLPDYYAEYLDGGKRWVELVLIADNTIYKKYAEDEGRIHDRLHSIASVVNSLYSPLNIRIGLVWADIWKSENTIQVTEEADKSLRDFLVYRKFLLEEHSHDNAHLLTDVRFGAVIGKAYKGTMCSYDFSGGVIVDHSENPAFVGLTVAHEMGHNFGMDHDVSPCNCAVDSCIMAPSSSNINATSFFSDCSLDTLSAGFRRGVDYCLHNVPKTAFGGTKCGNGILEDGEECDCGSVESCPNKCCLASECKLAKGAECADGDCCDLDKCRPKGAASVCREAENMCDLAEFCDGQNPNCPADFFVRDGTKCPDKPEDYCYQGICGSREQQCKFIWGPTAKNSVPECYSFNEYGSFSGNCGYNHTNEQYIRCNRSDVVCGRLQCQHQSEKPVFGDPSTVYSAYNYVKIDGNEEICRVIRTTFTGTGRRRPDPGMVPDGAKCGRDDICINASCRNKTEVLQTVSKCDPDDCNNKGICNNMGNCHCVNGYGGVGCDLPGYGGSVNSGPANGSAYNPGLTLLYLFIIATVTFIVASIFCRRKKGFWLHKKIWSKAKVALELRSFNLIPTRKAPPPPHSRIEHAHRQSWNAVWDDSQPPRQGEILRVDTTKPFSFGGGRISTTTATRQHHVHDRRGERPNAKQTSGRIAQKKTTQVTEDRTTPFGGGKHASAIGNLSLSPITHIHEEQRGLVAVHSGTSSSTSSAGESARRGDEEHTPPPIPPHRRQQGSEHEDGRIWEGRTQAESQKAKTGGSNMGDARLNVKALAAKFEGKL